MGQNLNTVKVLFEIRATGVSFKKTLTVGRQSFSCHPVLFEELAARYGYHKSEADWSRLAAKGPLYADKFFAMLGAEDISAIDISDYEGAGIVHDLNVPIPEDYAGQYDVVVDGGSLEHVFNFPAAIRNCMAMVKTGGSLIMVTPINNYCGHGLYQFSPELIFRILTDRNGFRVECAVAWEESSAPVFYAVEDPEIIGQRVEMNSKYPVLMIVQARKLRHCDRFQAPQQSDYTLLWGSNAHPLCSPPPPSVRGFRAGRKHVLRFLFDHYPHLARPLVFLHRQRYLRAHSLRHRPGFRRLGRPEDRFPSIRSDPGV